MSRPRGPFQNAQQRKEQPDPNLDRLVAAASRWGLGKVTGGIGYDYDQWLSTAGIGDGPRAGLGVWTKRDPDFRLLDPESLKVRWRIRQTAAPHAWDAGTDRFFNLTLAKRSPLQVASYDLSCGTRLWRVTVGAKPTTRYDDVATAPIGDSLAVLVHGRLSRLAAKTGRSAWKVGAPAGEGDFLGLLDDQTLLVGGWSASRLADPALDRKSAVPGVAAYSVDGERRWSWTVPGGIGVHVLGVVDGTVLLQLRPPGGDSRLAALVDGRITWTSKPMRIQDAALFGDVLVTRADRTLTGFDRTGTKLWVSTVRSKDQPFPYGFELAAQPALDRGHRLLAGTDALHRLDLRTGALHDFPLPRDGINTTWWPYQLVATSESVVVVTNTGAVVLER